MKVELTEKEVRELGYNRGLSRRRWKMLGLAILFLGAIVLVDYLEPESFNVWQQALLMLPVAIVFSYGFIRMFAAADKEGKALLKRLKEEQSEQLTKA